MSGFDAVAAAAELEDALRDQEPQAAPGRGYVEMLESEVESLGALLRKKEEELQRAEERAEEAVAEVERSKQRLARERDQELEQRTHKILLTLLEVLDDLDRALSVVRATDESPEVVAGVELVRKGFLKRLADHGVSRQEAVGRRFDPERHEAATTVPVRDPGQEGVVVGEIRAGYLIGSELLRPALVAVGKRA